MPWIWFIMAGIAAAGIIAVLHTFGVEIIWRRDLHQLRIDAHRLKDEYERRKAARDAGEFEIIEEESEAADAVEVAQELEAAA